MVGGKKTTTCSTEGKSLHKKTFERVEKLSVALVHNYQQLSHAIDALAMRTAKLEAMVVVIPLLLQKSLRTSKARKQILLAHQQLGLMAEEILKDEEE